MGGVVKFFISLKTTVVLLCLFLIFLFAGALIMPAATEFQSIHSAPLFQWMIVQPLSITWWLWGSICIVTILASQTLFCSIESLARKGRRTQWLLLISPQVIHAGFLFMLLAHLFSSLGGYKGVAVAREGTVLGLPDETLLEVKNILISIDPDGYVRDWAVDIRYLSEERVIMEDRLMPNRPSLRQGLGIYVKDLQAYPEKAVLLEMSREPGAIWALIGGILFTTGTVILLAARMRRER